ncbi:MAG: hypothetical protein H6815_07715 [Phycisphaeraceae bacterium]|nr:hypothetical protein [Phycisphaerales bacterium]MCB9860328.1 hypothetical protein [Phycisphaeraceae bacterium]
MNIKQATCALAMVSGFLLTMPGCIVWEIRDEMRKTNETLTQVSETLARVQVQLDEVNGKMDQVDKTNQILTDMQATSLKHLDEHLASLRKTIANIDSTIPFLSISDDPPEEETPSATPPEATPLENPGGKSGS